MRDDLVDPYLLHGIEALQQPAGALANAADRQEERENGRNEEAAAQGSADEAAGDDVYNEAGDHRRPCLQSSSRA